MPKHGIHCAIFDATLKLLWDGFVGAKLLGRKASARQLLELPCRVLFPQLAAAEVVFACLSVHHHNYITSRQRNARRPKAAVKIQARRGQCRDLENPFLKARREKR